MKKDSIQKNKRKITVIVPVRAGSRRLKNKNILPFGKSNLLVNKIEELKKVSEIDTIVVSSDSDQMLDMARSSGVGTHKRDLEYADDKSRPFGDVVRHICENVEGDDIMWATVTCPMIFKEHYSDAIKKYYWALENGYDSLLPVEPFKDFLWDDNGPLNYELGKKHVISQNLPQLYFARFGMLLAPRIKMIQWHYFHGPKPFRYVLDKINAVDIDDALDLEVARAWLNYLNDSR